MKKVLMLIFLLMIFVKVEASTDITGIYKEINNVTIYKTNNKVIIGDVCIEVSDNINASIIKLSGEAKSWLESINGQKEYYYIDDELFLNKNLVKKITIQGYKITIYDLNGNVVNESDNVILLEGCHYFSFEKIDSQVEYNKVNLTIEGKGYVIINGTIYNSSQEIVLDKSNTIIVMGDDGYKLTQVLIDDIDETSKFIDNKLNIDYINNTLKVIFNINEDNGTSNLIKMSGYITKDGLPVQNAQLILHSKELITYTDNTGFYNFDNVESGKHELLVISNNKVLGYTIFEISFDKNYILMGDKKVVVNDKDINVDFKIDNEYNIKLENIHSIKENIKNNKSYIYYMVGTIILTLLILVKKHKK